MHNMFYIKVNAYPKHLPDAKRAKSSEVKPRASSNATAKASPKANVAVVLEVGAKPNGQASEYYPKLKRHRHFLGIGPVIRCTNGN